MEENIKKLKEIIDGSDNIVFFGGAGVSTESGVPDFRSVDGLYNQEYAYPPETILSHSFYRRNPEEFYRFYRNKMLFPNAKPNMAHKTLAKLEEMGKLKAVITQNIDGCIRRQVAKTYTNYMAQYTEIIVRIVENSTVLIRFMKWKAYQDVSVVELSNQMLCYMRKD